MAGYSGTPVLKKLGIKPGWRVYAENAPDHYLQLLGPLPAGASLLPEIADKIDMVHLFTKEACELAARLGELRGAIEEDGVIWVSWPKKAAKVPTDVTEDVVREVALPLGLVDVKVCAVDEVWSGLKLVIRRENRKKRSV
jgi:hypothetical protein